MYLYQRIQAKTDNGDTVIDFLIEVMQDQLDGFKLYHRLDAARLLTNYGCGCKPADAQIGQATDFIINNPPEPSRPRADSNSSRDSKFDLALARTIQKSTDDGASVCRFLINVMEGHLKSFAPHHRISAARELLSRGFGKHARQELSPRPSSEGTSPRRSGEGRNPEPADNEATHSSLLSTHSSDEGRGEGDSPSTSEDNPQSHQSPNHTNHSSDDEAWEQADKIVAESIENTMRTVAELAEQNPDNPPYTPDFSALIQARKNSKKWFKEWKESLDPEEYEAIITEKAANFDAKMDARIERRKQIAKDRERRAKEEAEREAEEAEARAEAQAKAEAEEAEDPGPPPRSRHKRKLMFVLGDSIYVDCGHPDCDLHQDDRSRWRGSVQYGAGPTLGSFF